MNRASLYAGIAAVVIMAFPATAQNVGVGVGPVGVGIDFSPEQRTVVREYVRRDRPATFREQVVVGSSIPDDVDIRAVPREWGPSVTNYRYVYSGNRVYFIEPSTRKVIYVLED